MTTALDRAASLESEREALLRAWRSMERIEANVGGHARLVFTAARLQGVFSLLMAGLTALANEQQDLLSRAQAQRGHEPTGVAAEIEADVLLLRHMDRRRAAARRVQMLTTGLTLQEEVARALLLRADECGINVRDFVAEAVAAYLEKQPPWGEEDL